MRVIYLPQTHPMCMVEVDLDVKEGGSTLEPLQLLVGGRIELFETPDYDVWINEEGLLHEQFDVNMTASALCGSLLVGPAVVTRAGPNGSTRGVTDRDLKRFRQTFETLGIVKSAKEAVDLVS